MGIITAIEVQKKRGRRRSIFVDGQFVIGVHDDVVTALNLSVGQHFDHEQLQKLVKAETFRKAYEGALKLLAYRDRSISEIRKRLLSADFPEDVVDEVVSRLSNEGMLDDKKFSQEWVSSRATSKPMGKTRLVWELRSKGVDTDIIEEVLNDFDDDTELMLARSAAQDKFRRVNREDPSFRTRLTSFLMRRGFDWDVIRRVVDELCLE
ncbi:MAG: regulatory protein RecX [Armatimonadota bacterium]